MQTASLILLGFATASKYTIVDCLKGGCTAQDLLGAWKIYGKPSSPSQCAALHYYFDLGNNKDKFVLQESCVEENMLTTWAMHATQIPNTTPLTFDLSTTIVKLPTRKVLSVAEKIKPYDFFFRVTKVWKRNTNGIVMGLVVQHPLVYDTITKKTVYSSSLWVRPGFSMKSKLQE
jgi:hypothetical protein